MPLSTDGIPTGVPTTSGPHRRPQGAGYVFVTDPQLLAPGKPEPGRV